MKTSGSSEISRSPLSNQVSIILQENPELDLPLKLEEEVETIWQSEKAKRPLYDSFLFSLTSYDEHRLVGRFVKYRYFIASRQSPKLQEILQIYPLGVSGLCLCHGCVLVGIRDSKLSSYGGYFECVPSGGIEARAYMHGEVDFVAQAMWELQEEARISEKKVREVHPLGLYYSPKDGVYDIGLQIRLDLLEQEMETDGTEEYPLLKWYSYKEFEKKLHDPDANMVPLSRALWKSHKEIRG